MSWTVTNDLPSRPKLPPGYRLRPMKPTEFDGIAFLYRYWDSKMIDKKFVADKEAHAITVVAGEKILATAALLSDERGRSSARMLGLVTVDEEHRGIGLGKIMTVELMRYSVDQGFEELSLWTDLWRLPAIKMYDKLGFTPRTLDPAHAIRWRFARRMLDNRHIRPRTLPFKERKALWKKALKWEEKRWFDFPGLRWFGLRLIEKLAASDIPKRCPLCEAEYPVAAFAHSGYTIAECGRCGSAFVADPPTPACLAKMYDNSYYEGGNEGVAYGDYLEHDAHKRKQARKILKRITPHLPPLPADGPRRLLDVGCAAGFFVSEAQNMGWDAWGIDHSEFAVKLAREELGLKTVSVGSLEESNFGSESFDLITLWDVVEHLPDPRGTIATVAKLLRPGGIIALTTGNWRSWAARWNPRGWRLMAPPFHLFFLSPDNMKSIFSVSGLEVLLYETNGRFLEKWPWSSRRFQQFVRNRKKGDVMTFYAQRPLPKS